MTNFDLDELKVIIKSIVISSKVPIAVRDLLRDFKESEGRELPFAALGYSNVSDFLYDLKDTVKVLPDNTVIATKSAEIKHLVELIKKQRSPKKNRSRPKKRPSRYQPRFVNYSQTQYNRQRFVRPTNQKGALARAQYSDPKPDRYNDRQRIPAQYDMPKSSYSTVNKDQYYSRSNGYDKQRNGDQYAQMNNGEQRSGNQYACMNNSVQRNGDHYARMNNNVQRNGDQYTHTNNGRQRIFPDQYAFSSSSGSSCDSFEVVNCERISEEKLKINETIGPSEDLEEHQVSVTRVDYSSGLTPELKYNLRDIICEHPEGILCSQLSQLVRKKYGVPLNFRKYGFSSMIELVDSIPQIFKIEDCENNDWVLLDARRASAAQMKSKELSIPRKICDKVLEVSKSLACPFTIHNFDKRYENMFYKSLSEEVRGFPNVLSMLTSIDKSYIRLKKIDGDYYVFPYKQKWVNAFEACSDEEADEIEYPKNMLPFGGEVPPLEPFSDAITPSMEVKLGEIYGPDKFFMLSTYLMNAYSALQENIQLFYAESTPLALTDLPVKKGLYCAAPYLDKWHRAVITEVCDQTQVMVFLIDFGTYLKLSKSEVRFLHESFASIPRLGLRACLEDIIPAQDCDKFSREANILFYKLTGGKNLQALIKKVDFTQRKYLVELVDMDGDPAISISKILVAADVAKFRQNLNNSNVLSASTGNAESTPSDPSPSSALAGSFQNLSLRESPGEKKVSTESAEKEKKSPKSILLSLLSPPKKIV